MVAQKFSECFWETDFNGTLGFDRLVKRIKDGRTAVKEIEKFINDRAKIENEYSKQLANLAKINIGATESGSMHDVLVELRKQTAKSAELHQDMGSNLEDQAKRIQAIKERHHENSKKSEENVKKLQRLKRDLFNKTLSSQETYKRKSQAYDLAHQTSVQEKPTLIQNPNGTRQLEKLEKKELNAKEEKLKANDAYKQLVDQLEGARQAWEAEMTKMCETFQEIESDRLSFLRNELWVHVNLHSTTMYEVDQGNEASRNIMMRCDPSKDIQDFITSQQTGSIRPAAVVYESCDQTPAKTTIPRPKSKPPNPAAASTFFSANNSSNKGTIDDDPTYASIP